jgi:uncharacterized protein (TIGR01319 family)
MAFLALLIDFGSTFTKLIALDLDSAKILGRSQAPSTVQTDVRHGLMRALADLHQRRSLFSRPPRDLSALEGNVVLASSSAAGGLRIVVVGNVPGLTVQAAQQSALGAGAKIVGSTAFKLGRTQLQEIERLRPDLVLLTGGVDGGDSATIIHNATELARSPLSAPIVVAGNWSAAPEVCEILRRANKEIRLVDNVMPKAGTLAVEPAREEIRKLFMERIARAKGLDALRGTVPIVLPTPMAVLEGVRLGADGTGSRKGWGDMLVVDVGGATTDVHSIGHGHPAGENVIAPGFAEPYAKRTVEGDLGIRFNAATILSRVGLEQLTDELRRDFPAMAVSGDSLHDYIQNVTRETDLVPQHPWQSAADALLARNAVDLAIARHAGRRERIVARQGAAWMHSGKDLRDTRILIGTGGSFVYNRFAGYVLSGQAAADDRVQVLRPINPRKFVDSSYVLYAVGLLSERYRDVALDVFDHYLKPVE